MTLLRLLASWMLIAAIVAGPVPVGLALGCIPSAQSAAAPWDDCGCDDPDGPALGCTCIHYPAPQPPGSLAVFAAPLPIIVGPMVPPTLPDPPAAVPAREEPPDPPPPRADPPRV